MVAVGAAAKIAPALGWNVASAQTMPQGFHTLSQDYADFCATPPEKRVFYVVADGKIVPVRLDEKTWKPSAWGKPPSLPTPGDSWDGVPMDAPISGLAGEGPYQATWDSLSQYDAPEWYRDAKFGIWAHWSPQCVPEAGDWYARNMYTQNSREYRYQSQHYGPPSRFGYKDLCPQWTLLNWEPDALIQRYKDAGARLFLALANHHDGLDAWNSKFHPWNSANIGPHRDVIGAWAAAARKQDLRFGVTVHQARNWWWFQTAHGADDASGAAPGVPYDGNKTVTQGQGEWWQGYDPQQLYAPKHPFEALPDASFVKNFYDRTRDLIDQHDPDLLYFDNSLLPLGWGGMNIGAYFYNHNLKTRGGKMEAVVNIKEVPDRLAKSVVADYERGLTNQIMPYAWQSETCIGDWHYNRALYDKPGEYGGYLSPRDALHWMIDTVSKNGTFILNVPGKPDGTIDSKEMAVLDQIGAWIRINGEAIYATRPWTIYGEGPDTITSGSFQGNSIAKLGPKDIRFTQNKAKTNLYALILGWPTEEVVVSSLGTASGTNAPKVANVSVLGTDAKIKWRQTPQGLRVQLPPQFHSANNHAAAIKLSLA
ncbi:alpha-L-fucosidase [Silvibacterium bohemicum]|uniref:alpha-L-fucosidase n=1 Tax=Silvibacterium bohemicum TaxID=1577686 RepID=A0A841JVV3_9BACT|nr:alpha-L-fucosidase [Silvibacterium bohemicum]MBB6144675.1 alpha-L-fucosidase [Silvibacterium bohemicum]